MPSATARRYARAVLELAGDQKDLAGWGKRLAAVREVLEDPGTREILSNPSLPRQRRLEAMRLIAGKEMGDEGLNLALILVENRRVGQIGEIVDEFGVLADEVEGRVRATVTTAVELTAADRKRLEAGLKESLGKEVRLEAKVDPKIVGGLILQVGDHLMDASVAARLQQLRRRLAGS